MTVQLQLIFSLFLFLGTCQQEIIPEVYQPRKDHQGYENNLRQAGLEKSALGIDWIDASQRSLASPLPIEVPMQEAFYFSTQKAQALCYRFEVKRGEKILIEIGSALHDSIPITTKLFIDLFREDIEEEAGRVLVASADYYTNRLAFEPKEDAHYLLRIQPELLRGGRFTMSITRGPRLEFPVLGGKNHDIGSFFGDPRDGGRRKHHGVDIFAKRHTPIIAPCDGHIRFAGTRGLGGKVVWMRNSADRLTLYFAHLQEIYATDGANVRTGDTLGTVGNTGNAKTTPPHLHFGIYADGPIDPHPFVAYQYKKLKPLQVGPELLGTVVRTARNSTLEISPENKVLLSRHQWMLVSGTSKDQVRVHLPNGDRGLLAVDAIEKLDVAIGKDFGQEYLTLRDGISDSSGLISQYSAEEGYEVLARDAEHWYVRTVDGAIGWVADGD